MAKKWSWTKLLLDENIARSILSLRRISFAERWVLMSKAFTSFTESPLFPPVYGGMKGGGRGIKGAYGTK